MFPSEFIPPESVEVTKINNEALRNYTEHMDEAKDISHDNIERRLFK